MDENCSSDWVFVNGAAIKRLSLAVRKRDILLCPIPTTGVCNPIVLPYSP